MAERAQYKSKPKSKPKSKSKIKPKSKLFRRTSGNGRMSLIAPNLRLGDLALSVGISRSYLSKIIGRTRNPSVRVAQGLAKSLHISLDEVLRKIREVDW